MWEFQSHNLLTIGIKSSKLTYKKIGAVISYYKIV